MKNAIFFPIIIILAAMCCGGCKTAGAAPETPGLAGEYRDIERKIQRGQAELAITGERIGEGSRDIAEGLAALETFIAAAPEGDGGEILIKVRGLRATAEDHQAETEKLNVLLARERENSGKLSEQFNEYEQSALARLSQKDGEIADLREEKKKLAVQRNTLLAIVITAVSAIVIFVIVKVLRAFHVIPL
ncbi:MAG: hypothetical protein Pg6C_17230 [Treponemataceae bacterium]|nr:MAG: hypothetical protein Pg6C_17230 [Treponemataceae bacterium]